MVVMDIHGATVDIMDMGITVDTTHTMDMLTPILFCIMAMADVETTSGH